MLRGLTTRLLARCLLLWLLARAMLASLGLWLPEPSMTGPWLPAARTAVLVALAVAAILLLDVLRRRERVLLANLGLSLPALYALATLFGLTMEVAAAIAHRVLSLGGAA